MKIILSGGGTLGPVTPLLAMVEVLRTRYPTTQFSWVGTSRGPERGIVGEKQIPFFVITAGKWRRYWSLLNLFDLIRLVVGLAQALALLIRAKPDLLISAGGFVSVPLHWAGWLLGIPAWVHQQDVSVGLANRLMNPGAKKITTALQATATALGKRAEWLGNPCRELGGVDREEARAQFGLAAGAPVILAFGGGTGAAGLNDLVLDALPHLPIEWQVIHLVGQERAGERVAQARKLFPHYHPYPFLGEEMKSAYAVAQVVVARGGFGTLTELAALGKPAIIIPKPGTPQEANARYCYERGGLTILNEESGSGLKLAHLARALVGQPERAVAQGERLRALIPVARGERIAEIVEELVREK